MLVIRMSALGDVAMTIPVIYSVARRYPQLEISVLTRPFFASLFINAPANISIIEADLNDRHSGLNGMMSLLKELERKNFDYVADLHNVLRTWVIDRWMRLHGKHVEMVDKMRNQRGRLLKGRNTSGHPDFICRYIDVFERLGFPVAPQFTCIFGDTPPSPPMEVADGAIGIAPFARYANKTYPADMMEQVVARLSSRGTPVYLFGARGKEAAVLEEWEEKYPTAVSVAGRFSLAQELALMQHMSAMVSMDSANQHLASLTGCPVLTIWGSTTPACGFRPYGQNADNSICLGLDCQPCTIAGSNECHRMEMQCMRGIAPAHVVERIDEIIGTANP